MIARDGSGLSLDQVIARNLMREIEVFLPLTLLAAAGRAGTIDGATTAFGLGWALLFTFFPLFNRDRMRIGDLFAGTAVIRAPKRRLLVDLTEHLSPVASHRFTAAHLDRVSRQPDDPLDQVRILDRMPEDHHVPAAGQVLEDAPG